MMISAYCSMDIFKTEGRFKHIVQTSETILQLLALHPLTIDLKGAIIYLLAKANIYFEYQLVETNNNIQKGRSI